MQKFLYEPALACDRGQRERHVTPAATRAAARKVAS
jgi:hypothetical protein